MQEETPTSVAIVGLTSGESYDFRLQRTRPGYLASPAASVTNHFVVGRSAAPAALSNLTLAVVGGQALLRWDLPADLDVQFGGWILFRHSPAMADVAWADTTSIGRTVNGDQSHVYLPLKAGTYIARVYDSLGNVSEPVSITTKQASVLAFTPRRRAGRGPELSRQHDDTETLRRRAAAPLGRLRHRREHRRAGRLGHGRRRDRRRRHLPLQRRHGLRQRQPGPADQPYRHDRDQPPST